MHLFIHLFIQYYYLCSILKNHLKSDSFKSHYLDLTPVKILHYAQSRTKKLKILIQRFKIGMFK